MTLSEAEIERIKARLDDARRTPRKNADGSTTHFVCIDKSRLESWKAAAHAPGGMSTTIGVSGAALWLLVDAYETADEIAIDGEALLSHIAALQLQLDAARGASLSFTDALKVAKARFSRHPYWSKMDGTPWANDAPVIAADLMSALDGPTQSAVTQMFAAGQADALERAAKKLEDMAAHELNSDWGAAYLTGADAIRALAAPGDEM